MVPPVEIIKRATGGYHPSKGPDPLPIVRLCGWVQNGRYLARGSEDIHRIQVHPSSLGGRVVEAKVRSLEEG
jgi:hypothetical protein